MRFRAAEALDRLVMINLASTERLPDLTARAFESIDAFEIGMDADDAEFPGQQAALDAWLAG